MLVIVRRMRLHESALEETVRAGSAVAAASRNDPGCVEWPTRLVECSPRTSRRPRGRRVVLGTPAREV